MTRAISLNYARLSAAVRRAALWRHYHPGTPSTRQPNTQTNSDGSRDDSDRPPNTKVGPCPGHARQGSWIRILAGSHQQFRACCGGSGPELSPLRTLVICPALRSTQTPARLQTFTSPSNAITFIVPFAYCTKKTVPTTPATPAGVRTSNFPSGLAIFCACVLSFP